MSETYTVGGGRSDYRLPTVNTSDNGKVLKVVEGEWKKAEGGGSGLPDVTAEDAGKVLTVSDEGEWEAAAPAGSNGLYIMPFVVDGNNISISGSAVRYMAEKHPPVVAYTDPEDSDKFITIGLMYFTSETSNYGSSDFEANTNGFWWGVEFTYDATTDTYSYNPVS